MILFSALASSLLLVAQLLQTTIEIVIEGSAPRLNGLKNLA